MNPQHASQNPEDSLYSSKSASVTADLNQRFNQAVSALEGLDKKRLQALMLWFAQDKDGLSASNKTVDSILDSVSEMDPETCLETLEHLTLEDMIRFSVLLEFGEVFAQKKGYELLIRCIAEHIARNEQTAQMNIV